MMKPSFFSNVQNFRAFIAELADTSDGDFLAFLGKFFLDVLVGVVKFRHSQFMRGVAFRQE